MTVETSRRRFLRGAFAAGPSGRPEAPRPFGAVDAATFAEACTGCGDCARACPQDLIRRDRDGRPTLVFTATGCTFCGACTEACKTGALVAGTPWAWRAEADAGCLSARGVQCRACEDFCDAQAIRFRLLTGGRARPVIDSDACTGCGACIAPCPAGALTLVRTDPADGPVESPPQYPATSPATSPATETIPC